MGTDCLTEVLFGIIELNLAKEMESHDQSMPRILLSLSLSRARCVNSRFDAIAQMFLIETARPSFRREDASR